MRLEIQGYKDKHEFISDKGVRSVVYLMDCMDGLKQIPDKYFELAIVDPPYGIGADKPAIKPNMVKQKNGGYLYVEANKYKSKNWDNEVPTDIYFNNLINKSKNQIIWGVNFYRYIFGSGRIIWDKLNGTSDQYGCEIAYNSFNDRADIVRYMWQGMYQGVYCGIDLQKAILQQGNKSLNENRIHPTQKPIKLYEWLIRNYAKEGDKILDTHLGSGSSRIAAHKAELNFMGFELDEDYFRQGNERFMEVAKQRVLW